MSHLAHTHSTQQQETDSQWTYTQLNSFQMPLDQSSIMILDKNTNTLIPLNMTQFTLQTNSQALKN
jgi:hypothetical protein